MDTSQAATSSEVDLGAHLTPGERVLWQGRPEHNAFVWRTWPLSIFGAVLLLSVVTYEGVVLTDGADGVLIAWGVPFALVALYMLAGHFILTHLEWQHARYMVTDSRVLISQGIFSSRLVAYDLFSLPATQVVMHGRDIGNVMFKSAHGGGYGPGPGYQTMWPYPPGYNLGLMYVRNPNEIQGIIERARARRYGVRNEE